MLLVDRFSTPIATLVGDSRIVTHAVQAHFQIRPALFAGFQAAGRTGQLIFRAALPTMSRRGHKKILTPVVPAAADARHAGTSTRNARKPRARVRGPTFRAPTAVTCRNQGHATGDLGECVFFSVVRR